MQIGGTQFSIVISPSTSGDDMNETLLQSATLDSQESRSKVT